MVPEWTGDGLFLSGAGAGRRPAPLFLRHEPMHVHLQMLHDESMGSTISPIDAVRQAATEAASLDRDARCQLIAAWRALDDADCDAATAAATEAAKIIGRISAVVTAAATEARAL